MKELESFETVECIDKIDFLFMNDVVRGLDVFELSIGLVGPVKGEKGTTWLAVGENGNV